MRVLLVMMMCLVFAGSAGAQTTPTPPPAPAFEPATSRADGRLDFGVEGLVFPPVVITNGHTARTAQLLGEAYRRKEPLVWKRVQYVADLGRVALPAATPYLIEAMTDPAKEVRAEAARSAAMVGDESLIAGLSQLSRDLDTIVRREAMLALMPIARAHNRPMDVAQAVTEKQPDVMAAGLQVAWTPEHAALIASWIPGWPSELRPEVCDVLGRIKSVETAPALLPLLKGDVPQRAAAVRALGAMGATGQHEAVAAMLRDPHPTVRRAAVTAVGQLAPPAARDAQAIGMLSDTDPTVREAAARVLTPVPSTQALAALVAQLDVDYAPLHAATRQALIRPANASIRDATISTAAQTLAHANPRRREDASYVLGRLRSDAAIERHIALLTWDPAAPAKSDWAVISQAAESVGLIGDTRGVDQLMTLVKAAPHALASLQRPQRDDMARAMAGALVAVARLGHRPAMAEAVRILEIHPDNCPSNLRAAAAFAIGVLIEPGKPPPSDVNFFALYDSPNESHDTKLEAMKALGNMRHAGSADRLKQISETDATPDLRWIAHWSHERSANVKVPYTPPTERRQPPVTISDLPKNQP